ncbi:ATP-binding protein [Halobacteriaceae archaeon GCM10025711]
MGVAVHRGHETRRRRVRDVREPGLGRRRRERHRGPPRARPRDGPVAHGRHRERGGAPPARRGARRGAAPPRTGRRRRRVRVGRGCPVGDAAGRRRPAPHGDGHPADAAGDGHLGPAARRATHRPRPGKAGPVRRGGRRRETRPQHHRAHRRPAGPPRQERSRPRHRTARGARGERQTPEGRLVLRARREGDTVVVELEDDGRGIDLDAVRQAAVERGVADERALAAMSDDDVYDLVFHSQFSTRDEVTEVSGRGVGLDVVRRTVRDLTGSVEIDSRPDEGTTVRLTLPVSIAVTRVVFVESGGQRFAIPTSVVETTGLAGEAADFGQLAARYGITLADDEDGEGAGGQAAVLAVDDADPVGESSAPDAAESGSGDDADVEYETLSLSEAFDTGGSPDAERKVVRVAAGVRPVEITCEEIGDIEEVVIRPFDDVLGGTPGINGTTTGDVGIVPVVDVRSL